MFTGIIEELGSVCGIARGSHSSRLSIQAHEVLAGTRIGDSIAVNGVCLTVTDLGGNTFSADVMHETLNRSSLGGLNVGDVVNLERAMPADGRFGGHIVSGHIDCAGVIRKITQDDNAVWFFVSAPAEKLRYIVEKGSIAIDGISLTVARVHADSFEVSVIPHTQEMTNLSQAHVGTEVNLEFDIIGKYVEQLLGHGMRGQDSETAPELTEEFLRSQGF